MAMGGDRVFDIVIAGGGMIGATLALALRPLGLRVAIVEAVARSDESQPSFDDRSTALSRSTQRMYEAMGLWASIVAASTPITRLHVSDRGRFGFSHIDAEEQGVEALGYVVINRVLGRVLQEALDSSCAAEMICPARIVDARVAEDHVAVTTAGDSGAGREIRGKLLVAADGARSAVRDMLGIGARHVGYGQTAIVGNLLTEKPLANRAFERFTQDGPLALLPLTEGRVGFVWTLADKDAHHAMELDDADFLAGLQEAFGYRLGSFSKVGKRSHYPLALSKALRLTAPRAVLVGNAAHGLHPVAAQGFNLGLRDVATLCDCIADALGAAGDNGIEFDPGAAGLLDRYAAWRRSDQQKLVGFTDGLVRLFGRRARPVRVLRNIGMLGFDLVPGLRSLFAKHTMGLAGQLPRLSRGMPLT
jgi:2-octaprenyl-6-methoxyphenol hydroxylase